MVTALQCTGRSGWPLPLPARAGRLRQAADEVLGDLVRMGDEAASRTWSTSSSSACRCRRTSPAAGPGDRQQRFEVLRLRLLEIELVGFDDRVDLPELGHLVPGIRGCSGNSDA